MDNHLVSEDMPYSMIIGLGTEGIQTVIKLLKTAENKGHPLIHGKNIWLLLVDNYPFKPRNMEADPLTSYSQSDLDAAFVPLVLADKESRRRLYKAGKLWFLDPRDIKDPGVCKDGVGTGNRPSWGRALLGMNYQTVERRIMQGMLESRDHGLLVKKAVEGNGVESTRPLTVAIYASPVGGVANGALHELGRMVKLCAAEARIGVKTDLDLIDLGNLYPPNSEVGKDNRNCFFNFLRAESTGVYHGLEGHDDSFERPLFDSITILPNAGSHSQLGTLDEHEWFIANQAHLRHCSPMSHRLSTKTVDLNAQAGNDESGAPSIANAVGASGIVLRRNTYRNFSADTLAGAAARSILECPADDAAPQAQEAAREQHVLESYGESYAVRHLTQANGNDPDAIEEARGGFADQFCGLSGIAAAQAMVASHDWVMSELIPSQQVRMCRRAGAVVDGLGERLSREKAARAHDLVSFQYVNRWAGELQNSVSESARVNAEHLADLVQHREAVSQKRDACRKILEDYPRKKLLGRILGYFNFRFAKHRYRTLAERAISLEVEHNARSVAQENILLPSHDLLTQELEHLAELRVKLEAVASETADAADALLKGKPAPYEAPLGVGLGDAKCLKQFYGEVLEQKGGEAELIEQVRVAVVKDQGSLLSLLELPKEQLRGTLKAAAGRLFESDILALNVLEVFRERHMNAISSIMTRLVGDSRPWIKTSDDAERLIPVVKFLGVPDNCDEKWLLDELKKVDPSVGSWELVKLPNTYDSIIFLTRRSGISLTMLIDQQHSAIGEADLEWRVRNAADPLVASMPGGALTDHQACVVAFHAFSTGLLVRDRSQGWILNVPGGDPIIIGHEPDLVTAFFGKYFTEVVRVYSTFGDNLRVGGTSFYARVRQLAENWEQDKQIRELMTVEAVQRAVKETRLLLPFARAVGREERGQ